MNPVLEEWYLLILRKAKPWEIERLRAIADYQFGYPAGDALVANDAIVGVSPSTRRIREVYDSSGGLIAVLRASDYLFSLSLLGAEKLLQVFTMPRHRVIIGAYNGLKSVPCNVVKDVDPLLRPGDEVVVVDQHDNIIGVGRLRLPVPLILNRGCIGEAVRLRKRRGTV